MPNIYVIHGAQQHQVNRLLLGFFSLFTPHGFRLICPAVEHFEMKTDRFQFQWDFIHPRYEFPAHDRLDSANILYTNRSLIPISWRGIHHARAGAGYNKYLYCFLESKMTGKRWIFGYLKVWTLITRGEMLDGTSTHNTDFPSTTRPQ